MNTATIVKDKKGVYHIRISKQQPQIGGDVEVIEVLNQRDDESIDDFQERAIRFVKECLP